MDPLQSGELWFAFNNLYRLLLSTTSSFSFLSAENCRGRGYTHWKKLRLCDWSTLESQTDIFRKVRIAADVLPFGTNVHMRHNGIEQASFVANMKSDDVAMVSRHLNDRIFGYLTDFYRPMLEACAGCSAEKNYFVPQEHAQDPHTQFDDFVQCAHFLFPDYDQWCTTAKSRDGHYGLDEMRFLEGYAPRLAWDIIHYSYIFVPFITQCIKAAEATGNSKRHASFHTLISHINGLQVPGYESFYAYSAAWEENVKKRLPYPGTEHIVDKSALDRSKLVEAFKQDVLPELVADVKSTFQDQLRGLGASVDQIQQAISEHFQEISNQLFLVPRNSGATAGVGVVQQGTGVSRALVGAASAIPQAMQEPPSRFASWVQHRGMNNQTMMPTGGRGSNRNHATVGGFHPAVGHNHFLRTGLVGRSPSLPITDYATNNQLTPTTTRPGLGSQTHADSHAMRTVPVGGIGAATVTTRTSTLTTVHNTGGMSGQSMGTNVHAPSVVSLFDREH